MGIPPVERLRHDRCDLVVLQIAHHGEGPFGGTEVGVVVVAHVLDGKAL